MAFQRSGRGTRRHHHHAFVGNSPVTGFDYLGLLDPGTFWDDWSEAKRQKWLQKLKDKHKSGICAAAKKHCIPGELLAAITANEQIDYTWQENLWEGIGLGQSVGLGQITIQTAIDNGLTDCSKSDYQDQMIVGPEGTMSYVSADDQFRACVRSTLESNVHHSPSLFRVAPYRYSVLCWMHRGEHCLQ